MRKYSIASAIVALSAAAWLTGCTDKKWHIEGTVASGEGKSLVLEAPNGNGGWYPADTVTIGNGFFPSPLDGLSNHVVDFLHLFCRLRTSHGVGGAE